MNRQTQISDLRHLIASLEEWLRHHPTKHRLKESQERHLASAKLRLAWLLL